MAKEMVNWKASARGNSRWLTDGSGHNRNNNHTMWPEHVLTVLGYFLAAISILKVSLYVYGIKRVYFTSLLKATRHEVKYLNLWATIAEVYIPACRTVYLPRYYVNNEFF